MSTHADEIGGEHGGEGQCATEESDVGEAGGEGEHKGWR